MAPVNGELHAVGGGKVDFILIFFNYKSCEESSLMENISSKYFLALILDAMVTIISEFKSPWRGPASHTDKILYKTLCVDV